MIRKSACTANDIHDFGCQLIDDVKNAGWNQGLVLCVKEDKAGNWIGRMIGHLAPNNIEFATYRLIELLNEELKENGVTLEVVKHDK